VQWLRTRKDIELMLDDLGLGEMSRRLDELVRSPQGMDLNPLVGFHIKQI
jgi:hypothetical protein